MENYINSAKKRVSKNKKLPAGDTNMQKRLHSLLASDLALLSAADKKAYMTLVSDSLIVYSITF